MGDCKQVRNKDKLKLSNNTKIKTYRKKNNNRHLKFKSNLNLL